MKNLVFLLCFLPLAAMAAINPGEVSSNPVVEQKARAIFSQLRCPVCTHQALDESDVSIAQDIRATIRRHLEKGESQADVIAFMVDRYGASVLLAPPVKESTYILWFGPGFLLVVALLALLRKYRQSSK